MEQFQAIARRFAVLIEFDSHQCEVVHVEHTPTPTTARDDETRLSRWTILCGMSTARLPPALQVLRFEFLNCNTGRHGRTFRAH